MAEAFRHDPEFYTRDVDYLKSYIDQMATGLSIQFGITVDRAKEKIRQWHKEKRGPFKDFKQPIIEGYARDENDDRVHTSMGLNAFLANSKKEEHIVVPTFTAYYSPEKRQSPISEYVGDNVKERSVAKKEAARLEAQKRHAEAFLMEIRQKNKKENNNSLSGLFSALSSIFKNETGHNTLTSMTRSMSSIANALNERIIGGNRHYRDVNTAINNTLAIITHSDPKQIRAVMDEFNLKAPSTTEIMDVYKRSMRYYTFDIYSYSKIQALIKNTTEEQRAAIAFNQDLYHVRKYNKGFVRKLLESISSNEITTSYEDPVKEMYRHDEITRSYSHQVCMSEVSGLGVDYSKMEPSIVQKLANVCNNISSAVRKYKSFFDAFFLTKIVPNSTAFIQDMVRTTVVLSDTDSTMFSVDWWVKDYFGELDFSDKGYAIAGAVAYITSQVNTHCIAVLSGNMGVPRKNLFVLGMKPEFVFPVFVQSPVSKHYFTAMICKEGSVYSDIKMEIKGVHNLNSAISSTIIKAAHTNMERVIRDIMTGKKISMKKEINSVLELESSIRESSIKGDSTYFKKLAIKDHTSYSVEDPKINSIYAFHTLWVEVFQPKYGTVGDPEYQVVKFSTTMNTKTKFNNWLNSFKDQEMADRFRAWATRHRKKTLTTIYVSQEFIEAYGIPEEIVSVLDIDKTIMDLTNVRRMLLDSLGYTPKPEVTLSSYLKPFELEAA